jgi:hypothetical protein
MIWKRCGIAELLIRDRVGIPAESMRHRFLISVLSYCTRLGIAAELLRYLLIRDRVGSSAESTRHRFLIAVLSYCNRFGKAAESMCYRFLIAALSYSDALKIRDRSESPQNRCAIVF